jgi:CMP-N,N'-diacetyllegionaminic acid synthase
MMRILGFIPARGGSKGLPGKNKKILLGKPLIAHTIEAALQSNLTDIIVSTDDDEILVIGNQYGVFTIKRPEHLANDVAPTLPVLQHAVASLATEYDAVMTLQPTSPLRTTQHINDAIALFQKFPEADSLVSVVKAPHKFVQNSLMKMTGDYVEPLEDNLVLRRQEKPNFYGRNGAAIYITKISKINDFIFGGKIVPFEMNKLESVDIDDIEDWIMAEAIMQHKHSNK